ncbi:MAG: hypothetical protein MUQ10_00470, partial [Anaerolineae bacterium]|nr:hypothetical protein [Anaerolineae bacterium]
MSRWLTLGLVILLILLIAACTTAAPPTATPEPESSAPEVAAETKSAPSPTMTIALLPTATPSPAVPPGPPSDAEALGVMYPNDETDAYMVVASAPVRHAGDSKHLVITDNTLNNHCSGCPVVVEVALLITHGGTWQLERLQQVAAEVSTSLDNPPTARIIPLGPDTDGFILGGSYQGQGLLISTDTYIADVDGQFRQVFSLTTSESNRLSDACFEQQLCYEYGATVDLVPGDNPIYFNVRVTAGGTKLVDDRSMEFTEVATYTFSGETYTLTEKEEGVSVTPTPAALKLEGPDISYGGISFTVDPALGGEVFVDLTADSLGCTRFAFAPEGFCHDTGCLTICPVASYREGIMFGDDIIDGLQSAIENRSNSYFPSLMAHILLRSQTQHIEFRNGTGISSVVMKGQDLVFANNESVGYEFHGLTTDGQAYVSMMFPIDASILLSTVDPAENANEAAIPVPELPDDDMDVGVAMRDYNLEAQRQLDLLDASGFT